MKYKWHIFDIYFSEITKKNIFSGLFNGISDNLFDQKYILVIGKTFHSLLVVWFDSTLDSFCEVGEVV